MTQEGDREFDKYLEGDSGLSDAYGRLPQDGPPAHLDHAILAEAHRAVSASRGRAGWRKWSVPLSIAATLVVVVLVGLERPYMPQEGGGLPAIAPASTPVTSEEMRNAQMDRYQEAPSMRQGMARRGAEQEAAPAMKKEAAPAPRLNALREEEGALRAPVAGKPAAPPATGMEQDRMRMQAVPQKSVAAPSPAQDKLKAAPPPPAMEEAAPAREMAPAPAMPAMTEPAAAPASKASAPPVENMTQPQEWLVTIRKLKQEGKRAQAKRELAAFSKRFPSYVIPKDLRDLRQ